MPAQGTGDGGYDSDPESRNAKRYDALRYIDVLSRDLRLWMRLLFLVKMIFDSVFSISDSGGFDRVLKHEGAFTLVNEVGTR